jgi:hypothetical protein
MPIGNGWSPRSSSVGASGNIVGTGFKQIIEDGVFLCSCPKDSVCVTWDNLKRRNINYLISTGHTLGA